MSYPDFGCYAECLTCELCDGELPPGLDLDFDMDDYDRVFGDGDLDLDDWAPPGEDEGGNIFDDLELPDLYPWGGPVGDGWGGGMGGKW